MFLFFIEDLLKFFLRFSHYELVPALMHYNNKFSMYFWEDRGNEKAKEE